TALKRLVHPASLACVDEASREFFDFVFAREVASTPVGGYKIVRIASLAPGAAPGVPPNLFRYPVPPTHEIQIDFKPAPTTAATVIRQIALLDGAWYAVWACPTAAGLARFRERQVQMQAPRTRAEALAADGEAPLRPGLR